MDPVKNADEIGREKHRVHLLKELAERGVSATPQAVTALLEAALRSFSETCGDTDSLLAGLLYSGSYTVDVLQDAGVNPFRLREVAASSVRTYGHLVIDPISQLLECRASAMAQLLAESIAKDGKLETADILRAAISPYFLEQSKEVDEFPFHLRKDSAPQTRLMRDLEYRLCQIIIESVDIIHDSAGTHALKTRRRPVSGREVDWLVELLPHSGCDDLWENDTTILIELLNSWFVHRKIISEPQEHTFQLIEAVRGLDIGPSMFLEAGGDLKSVDVGLQTASRVSPERDLPTLALILRDGLVQVATYSYRNCFAVETQGQADSGYSGLFVHSVRPVGLLSREVLNHFEWLISNPVVGERQIQAFLEMHPEFFEALGYCRAKPHLILRSEQDSLMIPDFFLEVPGTQRVGILDLKLPNVRMTVRSPYLRVSAELSKAVGQLRAYERFFDNPPNRKKFEEATGLRVFKPELIIVMGRSAEFREAWERNEIEDLLGAGRLRLATYDEILHFGKSRVIDFLGV